MGHPWINFERDYPNENLNCDQLIAILRKIYGPVTGDNYPVPDAHLKAYGRGRLCAAIIQAHALSSSVPMDKDGYLPLSTLIILDQAPAKAVCENWSTRLQERQEEMRREEERQEKRKRKTGTANTNLSSLGEDDSNSNISSSNNSNNNNSNKYNNNGNSNSNHDDYQNHNNNHNGYTGIMDQGRQFNQFFRGGPFHSHYNNNGHGSQRDVVYMERWSDRSYQSGDKHPRSEMG